jgi:putative transposase
MPRRARFRLAGHPIHLIQRGNNRSACFRSERDRVLFLGLLNELGREHRCAIHGYVLMTNHVHLLLTPMEPQGPSLFMKHLGQRYVQHFNKVHGRTGSLWEGRFRSSIVESSDYFFRCQRYIELNPVRAGMVVCPEEYPGRAIG